MLAIFQMVVTVAEVVTAIVGIIDTLYETGLGLRWLLSPSFREEMRLAGNETKRRNCIMAAAITCFMLAMVLITIAVVIV